MNKALANRIGRVEDHARLAWRPHRETRCPWEWTKRLAEFNPRYQEILDVGVTIAKAAGEYLGASGIPEMHAGILEEVLVRHSRLIFFLKNVEDWNPSPEEFRSYELFSELHRMGGEYIVATDDLAPCHLHWWKDPRGNGRTGWSALSRGRGARR